MIKASALLAVLPALWGCGYALVGRSSTLPEDVRSIYIQALNNQTRRSQVDQVLTRAIAQEFVTRQRFRVVGSFSEADAVLSGTVLSFRVRPISFGTQGRATQYEIIIGAKMEFKRTSGDDAIIWKQDNYQFRETYEANVSETDFFSREDIAIAEVADRFAETMVIDLLEGF
jgi:outer membrane lipopolysaccharide assembly protein LptE/RlpB